MMNRITVDETAKTLHLTSEELCLLLDECGITPDADGLTLTQANEVMQYSATSDTCYALRGRRILESDVSRYTLFLDACAILDDNFPLFVENITPLLQRYGKAMVVPSGVVLELKRLFLKKLALRERIAAALDTLETLKNAGLVELYGDRYEDFGDQQIISIATSIRVYSEALFITRDKALSEDILRLNEMNSVQGSTVAVSRINRLGYLSRYIPDAQRQQTYPAA